MPPTNPPTVESLTAELAARTKERDAYQQQVNEWEGKHATLIEQKVKTEKALADADASHAKAITDLAKHAEDAATKAADLQAFLLASTPAAQKAKKDAARDAAAKQMDLLKKQMADLA